MGIIFSVFANLSSGFSPFFSNHWARLYVHIFPLHIIDDFKLCTLCGDTVLDGGP